MIIKVKDNINEHLSKLKSGDGVYLDNKEELIISFIFKEDEPWKFLVLANCCVVGLLDRNKIKALVKYPGDIYVGDSNIAKVSVDGLIVNIKIRVNNDINSMKSITNKIYSIDTLMVGMRTFMAIYYNLYQTNQFNKALEYLNTIPYQENKWEDYLDKKMVLK